MAAEISRFRAPAHEPRALGAPIAPRPRHSSTPAALTPRSRRP